jgi:putative ABC transport system ATP-binding protein
MTQTWTTVQDSPAPPAAYALETVELSRVFDLGGRSVQALSAVNFRVQPGESVAIMGPSGGGKSTLLALLGGLDTPSAGEVRLFGQVLADLSEAQRVRLRRGSLGYIFQGYDLLPALSVLENVEYPLLVSGLPPAQRRERAHASLAEVGLADKAHFLPDELSGGQQQRVGIARCLVSQPGIVLADEPTGNLDSATTTDVLDLLLGSAARRGMTLIMVTHDPEVAARLSRTVQLRDGQLEGDS